MDKKEIANILQNCHIEKFMDIHDNQHVEIHNHVESPHTPQLSHTELDVKGAIEQLAQSTDDEGNPIFREKSQWWAVYKLLSEKMDYPKTMSQFCRSIGDLGLELPDDTPKCDYESIRKVNPLAINLGLWHSHISTAPESQRKQMIIALRLAEILGIAL